MSTSNRRADMAPPAEQGPLAAHAAPYLGLAIPSGFYILPDNAIALYSTKNGSRPKRALLTPPPRPAIRSDFDEEVKRFSWMIRCDLPVVAAGLKTPSSWFDLYSFFDAVDLWVEGPVFLYFVLTHISRDNQIATQCPFALRQQALIFQFTRDWVYRNADRVANLPNELDLTTLLSQSEMDHTRRFTEGRGSLMLECFRYHQACLIAMRSGAHTYPLPGPSIVIASIAATYMESQLGLPFTPLPVTYQHPASQFSQFGQRAHALQQAAAAQSFAPMMLQSQPMVPQLIQQAQPMVSQLVVPQTSGLIVSQPTVLQSAALQSVQNAQPIVSQQVVPKATSESTVPQPATEKELVQPIQQAQPTLSQQIAPEAASESTIPDSKVHQPLHEAQPIASQQQTAPEMASEPTVPDSDAHQPLQQAQPIVSQQTAPEVASESTVPDSDAHQPLHEAQPTASQQTAPEVASESTVPDSKLHQPLQQARPMVSQPMVSQQTAPEATSECTVPQPILSQQIAPQMASESKILRPITPDLMHQAQPMDQDKSVVLQPVSTEPVFPPPKGPKSTLDQASVPKWRPRHHLSDMPMHSQTQPQPQMLTYSKFMESQRMMGRPASLREVVTPGYSDDASSSSRARSKPGFAYGRQNHQSFDDRRIPSHGVLPGPSSPMNDPFYVHTSQLAALPHAGGPLINRRNFSDPQPQLHRMGDYNDPRLWDDSIKSIPFQSQKPTSGSGSKSDGRQTVSAKPFLGHPAKPLLGHPAKPFLGHPQAKCGDKSATFYYDKAAMERTTWPSGGRTLYIHGADLEMFTSHTLKDMMSEVGEVESIGYCFTNPTCGPAFINFTESEAVSRGISRFKGTVTPLGLVLDVDYPSRSSKQSKYSFGQESSQHTYSKDPDRNNSRYSLKNPAQSRQDDTRPTSRLFVKSQAVSTDAEDNHCEAKSPLTPGLQMPLESINNLSLKDKHVHRSPRQNLQVNKKENCPIKGESTNVTPTATLEKGQLDIYSSETSQVGISKSEDKFTSYEKDFATESNLEGYIHPVSTARSALEAEHGTTSTAVNTPHKVDDLLALNSSDDAPRPKKNYRPRRNKLSKQRRKNNAENGGAGNEDLEPSPDASLLTMTIPTDNKGEATSFSSSSNSDHGTLSAKSVITLSAANAPRRGNLVMDESPVDEKLQTAPTLVTRDSKFGGNSSSRSGSSPKPQSSQEQCQSNDSKTQDNAFVLKGSISSTAEAEPHQSASKKSCGETLLAATESSQSEGNESNDKAHKADTLSSEGTEVNDKLLQANTKSALPEATDTGLIDMILMADGTFGKGNEPNDKTLDTDKKSTEGMELTDKTLEAGVTSSECTELTEKIMKAYVTSSEGKELNDETLKADTKSNEGNELHDKALNADTKSDEGNGNELNDEALNADTMSNEGTELTDKIRNILATSGKGNEPNDKTPNADAQSSVGTEPNDKSMKAGRKSSQPKGNGSNKKNQKADNKSRRNKGKGSNDKGLKISLKDPEEWPALAPTKTPASIIVDGKPPVITDVPVIQGYSTVASSNAVPPAPPVNTNRRRANLDDLNNSQIWPRVIKRIPL